MDGINWGGLVPQRNIFDQVSQGFERGQDMRLQGDKARREAERQKAFNLFATDPQAAEDALMASGDIEAAETLRKRRLSAAEDARRAKVGGMVQKKDYAGAQAAAIEGGDFDMAKTIGGLNEAQRKAARDRADDLAGFGLGIKGQPYEARKAIIEQAKPILVEQGFTPEQIAAFDPTDQNIDALVASATDLKTALEEQNRQRDDKRSEEALSETKRSNRTREGISRGQLGVAQSNSARGWAAHKARLAAKGYGTPGFGGPIADEDVEIDP